MTKFVVMQLLCIGLWFSVTYGRVVPPHSPLLLKTIGNNVEIYGGNGNGGSWLQMVLIFSRDSSINQSALLIEDKPTGNRGSEVIQSPQKAIECKDGFVLLESQLCYLFGEEKKTWSEALEVCKSLGTTLAHPMNPTENTALVNHLKTNYNGTNGIWYFGGSDVDKEGEWVWAHDKAPIMYTDWIKGQPDDYKKVEDCVHYWEIHGWKWNDFPCNVNATFICQQ